MKKIKKIIIITAFIIVMLILSIVLVKNKVKTNQDNTSKEEESLKANEDLPETIEVTNNITEVTSRTRFDTIEKCIQRYYDDLNEKSSSFYIEDENGTAERIVSEEEINKLRLDLLSEEYIKKNNITLKNINMYIPINNEKVIVTALRMKEIYNDIASKYLVYGYISNLENKKINEFYIFVNLDTTQKTFSIEPINGNYEDIDKIKFENQNKRIEKNENNGYVEKSLNYEETAKKYFNTYKRMVLSNPEFIYEYCFDKEYRETRFGNFEKFSQYIEKNREEIYKMRFEKYLVNEEQGYTQFVCKDQYDNVYIFNEKVPMKFDLKLDTYTIETTNFKEKYEEASEKDKINMNINKWIMMLNSRDYQAAYNVLDEDFRKNKFGSVQKFEEYMRREYPSYYEIRERKIEKESNAYVVEVYFVDMDDKDNLNNKNNIIMQLKEGTSFVMSFNVKNY